MRVISSLRNLLFALVVLAVSTASRAQVVISVAFGPPPLPVYGQPLCPGMGYIWTPGYWAWDPDFDDYFWVPGTWMLAPEVGFLWTPPWWGWSEGVFIFHEGWWGPVVGFYGGVDYGFGYFGSGFVGGRWEDGQFFYNRAVTNVNVVNIRNVYNQTVVQNNVTVNRVSYNGGPGGVQARPRPEEEAAARARHIGPVAAQTQHGQAARANPELRATANHGKPPVAATARPAEFRGGSVVAARAAGGPYHPPAGHRGGTQPRGSTAASPVHPRDLPPFQRPGAPNTSETNRDRKYQQKQERLFSKQEQERQKLQQRQDQEHQRMERRNANESQRQQMEQRHQQQTQQLQQKHVEQQQRMQERQKPPRPK